MAAFKDVKVTFSFDYSKDINGRKYTSEALHKALDDFNNEEKEIPLAVKLGDQRIEIGKILKADVDGTEVRYTAEISQAGSIETGILNDLEVSDMKVVACSLVGGLPIYLQQL